MASIIVRDAETKEKLFEIWAIDNDVTLNIYTEEHQIPFVFEMDTTQAENLITALNQVLSSANEEDD